MANGNTLDSIASAVEETYQAIIDAWNQAYNYYPTGLSDYQVGHDEALEQEAWDALGRTEVKVQARPSRPRIIKRRF